MEDKMEDIEEILDFFDFEGLLRLIQSIQGMISALLNLFGTTFSWLGPGILGAIGVGATVAIILRVMGR